MILLVDNQGKEELVTVDRLVECLHPQADTCQILFDLTRTARAVAKLKDGRTVDVQCRPDAPAPEPQAILPFPEETFEVPVSLQFSVTGTVRIRARSTQHAAARIEDWLKQISQYTNIGAADADDVIIAVPKMVIYDAGLVDWEVRPPQRVNLLEYQP